METYFKCSVKRIEMDENGNDKKVTDEYVVDAMSYTEAEARIIEEVKDMKVDMSEIDISRYRIDDVVDGDGMDWFKITCDFITIDERSGDEKRKAHSYLVMSNGVTKAIETFEGYMKGTMVDWELVAVKKEKKIVDHIKVELNKGSGDAEGKVG